MEYFEPKEFEEKFESIEEWDKEDEKFLEDTEDIEDPSLIEMGFTKDALEPYFAGLVASDGHLERDKYSTTVSSADKDFMRQVIKLIVKEQGYNGSYFWDEEAGVYKVKINSKPLWDTMTEKYAIPPGEKSRQIKPPEGLNKEQTRWHIKGWFDGDGWVEEMIKWEGRKEYCYPRAGLKTMSKEIRDWIADSLRDYNIRVSTYDRKDGSYGLWVNGYE